MIKHILMRMIGTLDIKFNFNVLKKGSLPLAHQKLNWGKSGSYLNMTRWMQVKHQTGNAFLAMSA
ncbi:hypothetical protein [Mucilaginibacter humi]|uniref:hypothetical protein n=1 Tax=Mucilaginibacter humi TaxID=2732510 RepID=UPI001C2EA4CD|nr:hypothetical protein [Mucilaginibacter humi]